MSLAVDNLILNKLFDEQKGLVYERDNIKDKGNDYGY
jgi:hypothetical protein